MAVNSGQSGLLFVATDDPIGKLISEITKQPYCNLGFICPSNLASKRRVYWLNPWGQFNNIVVDGFIEDIMQQPLITKLAYRKLKSQHCSGQWGLAVASTLNEASKASIKQLVFYLFGYNSNTTTDINNSLAVLERVFQKLGWIVPTAQLELTSNDYKTYNNNTDALVNIISQMSSPFISQRNTFQALLQIEDYFEPMQNLALPVISPSVKTLALTKSLEQCQPLIAEATAVVFKEMLINPAFMQVISRGFNQVTMMKSLQQQNLLSVVSSYMLLTDELLKAIDKCKIDNKDVKDNVKQLKQLNSDVKLLF